MTKKNARTTSAKTRQPFNPLDVDERSERFVRESAEIIASLAPVARFLVLHGMFQSGECSLASVVQRIASEHCDLDSHDRTTRESVAVLSKVPNLTDDQRRALAKLDDIGWMTGEAFGEAGYLLGVAVGLQLRPEMFAQGDK